MADLAPLSALPMTLRILYVLATSQLPLTRGDIHTKLGNVPRDVEITRPLRDLRRPWHGYKVKTLRISRTEYRYFLNWRQKAGALKFISSTRERIGARKAAA